MASIPLRMILYVFIGSDPEKGGLKKRNFNLKVTLLVQHLSDELQ